MGSPIFAPWERRRIRKGSVLDADDQEHVYWREDSAIVGLEKSDWSTQREAVIPLPAAKPQIAICPEAEKSITAEEVGSWKRAYGESFSRVLWDQDQAAGQCELIRCAHQERIRLGLGSEWNELQHRREPIKARKYGWRESLVYEANCLDFQETLAELRQNGAMSPQMIRQPLPLENQGMNWRCGQSDTTNEVYASCQHLEQIAARGVWQATKNAFAKLVHPLLYLKYRGAHEPATKESGLVFITPLLHPGEHNRRRTYGTVGPLSHDSGSDDRAIDDRSTSFLHAGCD